LFVLIDVSTAIIAWLLPDWVENLCNTDKFSVLIRMCFSAWCGSRYSGSDTRLFVRSRISCMSEATIRLFRLY